MSMTVDIYNAMGAKVEAFATGLAEPIPTHYTASPIPFVPPDSGEWLEVRAFWNGNENYAWGSRGASVEKGFFVVGVVSRSGGVQAAQPIAELLVEEFEKSTELATALVYKAPEISGPLTEDDRLTVPVTIYWRATR